jgi:hypothetical protein
LRVEQKVSLSVQERWLADVARCISLPSCSLTRKIDGFGHRPIGLTQISLSFVAVSLPHRHPTALVFREPGFALHSTLSSAADLSAPGYKL